MWVAVTGASGFIGSHLAVALAARGHAVRCLLRPTSSRAALPAAAETVVADHLADRAALQRLLHGADAVVHLAGLTRSWTPHALHEVNRGGTEALCAAAARAGPALRQIILVSSQAAVGPSSRRHPRREDDPPAPVTAYGRSKLAGERVRLRYPGLPVTVVRPPAVYGPGDRDIFAYFRLVRAGLRPELVPASRLSMVYVGNLVDALLLALDQPQRTGQRVYHVADRGVLTMSQVARWIAHAYGRRALRIPVPQAALTIAGLPLAAAGRLLHQDLLLSRDKLREIAQPAWLLATSRIAEQLGYHPRLDTRDAVALTAQWYLDHGWLR
jgi:nucleoside-diphosphate-sugar epimerase